MAFIGSLNQSDPLGADPRFANDLENDPREVYAETTTFEDECQEDDSCVALDFSDDQRVELEDLIGQATTGTMELSRDLKSWEPNKLNARHIQMIMMKASGLRQGLIAEILGVGEANVSTVVNHPYAQTILNRVLSYAAEQATDIQARIKAHAPEMLDILVDATRASRKKKPELASKNAFELLKMAGYGAVEKKEVVNKIEIPERQVGLLTQAIEESKDVTALSRISIKRESIGGPGSQEQSSPVVPEAATPPRSGSHGPTNR